MSLFSDSHLGSRANKIFLYILRAHESSIFFFSYLLAVFWLKQSEFVTHFIICTGNVPKQSTKPGVNEVDSRIQREEWEQLAKSEKQWQASAPDYIVNIVLYVERYVAV